MDVNGWIWTIVLLIVFPPVGIFLLFRQLMGYGKSGGTNTATGQHPYDIQRQQAGQGQAYTQSQGQSKSQSQSHSQSSKDGGYHYNYQYEYHYNKGDLTGQQPAQTPKGKKIAPANAAKLDLSHGKIMTLVGGILSAGFGMITISELLDFWSWGGMAYAWSDLIWPIGFFLAGLVVMYAGVSRTKKGKRFAKYLTLVGNQKSVSVEVLARTMGRSVKKTCDDLEEMLERELLPVGYLDRGNGLLILSADGVTQPPREEKKTPQEERQEDHSILQEIREVNNAIPDPDMSRKIHCIEEITGKILEYQRKNPGKDAEVRSFLDYYLPTTLKILRAYAQLDAQGIQGENITSSKLRIEGMMDKVVEGFEKQLDKLFQADSMDIASDVQVLEQMLQKDGLSGGGGMTLEL